MSDRHDPPDQNPQPDHGPGQTAVTPASGQVGSLPPASTPSAPALVEDAGSQALAEALRSSFAIVKIIMVILVIVFVGSGVFTVPSQKKAIILRFGKPVGAGDEQLLGPGLHWSFPKPIDEVVYIPIGEIQTVTSTVGWYGTTPEAEASGNEPEPGLSLNPATEGYALSADGNIFHARATLRYRISRPLQYELNFVNASNMVQSALDNALLKAAAHSTVDEALLNVAGFQEKVLVRVRELVDQLGLGISVEQGEVRTIPPRQVKLAFQNVLTAELERRKAVNDAQAYSNRVFSTSLGESNAVVNTGQTARTRLLEEVAAEARYFADQLPHYRADPKLFLTRLQTETLHRVLTNTQVEKVFLPARADGKPRELRLQLSREPQKPAAPAAPSP
ncbi:MAG: protease modulator HflK [Chloroflexi bacterium]|nr:protease modulator HflK [Chloroflexota bacterium]